MRKTLTLAAIGLVAAALLLGRGTSEAGKGDGKMLAHMVFFTLKDNSADAKKKLVDSCKKYLSGHPGEVYFSAGVIAEDLKREVNDKDFDVALHIVFKDRASHDLYQDAPKHKTFIAEGKSNWKTVRVFDSYVGK